ncbi:MAG TPA: hypothetical protein VML55_09395, partial [Planctomycetaceae bacterium]|nr:hypothetical protein [Planctomycetaceae bacterium]
MTGSRLASLVATGVIVPALLASGLARAAAQDVDPAAVESVEIKTAPAAGAAGTPAQVQPVPTPSGQPMPDGKPAEAAKPGEKPGEKKDEPPKTIQRPTKPESAPDPAELQVRPDASGKLRFNFRGQPWPAVLDWLASVSNMSLDWTELPGDYLNLVTRRSYTVEEARDLINQHLLARGFTILRKGEVLSVRSTKNLDLSLVPRVDAAELAERQPHEFVKITFKLDWLPAEQAVTEFKPILSTNSTLVKLPATNRIEAADAVINLRELHRLLVEEQSPQGQERLVQVFRLTHMRASIAHDLLKQFLELDKSGPAVPMTPEQQQQQAMLAQRAAQQAQPQGKQPPAGPDKEPKIALIVHERENAILAHAAPDKMAIIAQTIKALDVEPSAADSLLRNMDRMQVFRLSTADPQ